MPYPILFFIIFLENWKTIFLLPNIFWQDFKYRSDINSVTYWKSMYTRRYTGLYYQMSKCSGHQVFKSQSDPTFNNQLD